MTAKWRRLHVCKQGIPLLLIGGASGQCNQGNTAVALYLSPFQ